MPDERKDRRAEDPRIEERMQSGGDVDSPADPDNLFPDPQQPADDTEVKEDISDYGDQSE